MNFFNKFRKYPAEIIYEIQSTDYDCDCGCDSNVFICNFSRDTVFFDGGKRIHISDVRRGMTICGLPIIDIRAIKASHIPLRKHKKRETYYEYMGFTVVVSPKNKKIKIGSPIMS